MANSDDGNMVWVKTEPLDSDAMALHSDDSDCGEWPRRINLEPEIILEEGGVRKFVCFYCQEACEFLNRLKKHIKKKHSNLYRSGTDKENIKSLRPGDSGLRKENRKNELLSKQSKKEKAFSSTLNKQTVKTNLKSHTVSKRSKKKLCPYCEFSTLKSGNLKRHIMGKHTKEKRHLCPDCDYGTIEKRDLQRHIMAKHTNEKPYACTRCEYRTAVSGHLKRHIKAIHNQSNSILRAVLSSN